MKFPCIRRSYYHIAHAVATIFFFSCEEDILAGVQFLLSEENLQKLVEEEHKDPEEELLTREEKADLEVCEESLVAEEVVVPVDVADVPDEEGTRGGYFDLLPVSEILHKVLKAVDTNFPTS